MLALSPLTRIPELGTPGKYAKDIQLTGLIPTLVLPISRSFHSSTSEQGQETVFPMMSKAVVETNIQNSQLPSPSLYDNHQEHG